jgi:hypothetical protein
MTAELPLRQLPGELALSGRSVVIIHGSDA